MGGLNVGESSQRGSTISFVFGAHTCAERTVWDALGRTMVGSGQFPINSTLRCPITSRGSILACVSCRTGSPAKSTDGSLSLWPPTSSSCYFTIATTLVASLVFPKSILFFFSFKRGINKDLIFSLLVATKSWTISRTRWGFSFGIEGFSGVTVLEIAYWGIGMDELFRI
ncbi:hypothetical protein B296_00039468 [Ensete ventricosum]|uniref:Uncharacterized protein n=1 Tax=Ensete ventricosum TaxID=4639 RepID=A0A426Y0B1_ENSVE|nr:hypothetical protein B296_00039468 [Ensete ventricosum]